MNSHVISASPRLELYLGFMNILEILAPHIRWTRMGITNQRTDQRTSQFEEQDVFFTLFEKRLILLTMSVFWSRRSTFSI